MNNVVLEGRLTRDPDIRYTDGGGSVARISLAVNRRFKKEGQPEADFINCVAFGKTAEFIEKWFQKGDGLTLQGMIQTGSYTNNDGVKVYTTDVRIESVEFPCGKAGNNNSDKAESRQRPDPEGFMSLPEGIDEEELPFN